MEIIMIYLINCMACKKYLNQANWVKAAKMSLSIL